MSSIIRELPAVGGELFVTRGGNKYRLAEFSGCVEIYEDQYYVPRIGQLRRGPKKIHASFMLCEDIRYLLPEEICDGRIYSATAMIHGEHEIAKLLFDGLRYEDSDPIEGTVTFEIEDLELIERLLKM